MTNFLIEGIIIIFLFSLFIIGSLIISMQIRKTPTEEELELNRLISKMGLVIIPIAFGIVLIMFTIVLLTDLPIMQKNDISNWITLLVEIAVGFSIALLILFYSQFRETLSRKALEKEVRRTADRIITETTSTASHYPQITTSGEGEIMLSSDENDSQAETANHNKQNKENDSNE